jgi:hypothetical protein|tara:strand:+ start:2423 stop:2896 length:474 start_codon:yes stop_codon:yes gene_type:complete
MTSRSPQAHKSKLKPLLTAFLILTCATTSSYAEVYKWTDKSGNTHYSDIKPNEVVSEKLNIKTTNSTQARTSPQASAQRLDQTKAKELQAQAERLQSQAQNKETKTQCQSIRDNLKTLQENSRIKINEDGALRYMTPEEIENKKQEYLQQINNQCSN